MTCKCSFLEIYNESITDLLNPSETHLHIREAAGGTTYVENLSEEEVPSGAASTQCLFTRSLNPACVDGSAVQAVERLPCVLANQVKR